MALQSTIPTTTQWNLSVGIIMIFSNLFAIAIGRFAIKSPGQGINLTGGKPGLWKNFGLPELLATMSFGHILGAGFILGLSSAGIL
jgi:photosystem I subunit X